MDILENYHNSKLHYRMLRDVALNVELEFNKMNTQLFESDIQRYMDDFLRSNLKNTDCYPHREACNKTDLVVFQTHDDGGKKQKKGIIFFEIKTVFKNHESFLHNNFVEKIRKDLCKLKDIKEKYSRAFFVLVFRKNKVNDMDNMQDISAMINNKLASKSYQKHFSITVKDEKVNVRASRKCIIDNTAVLSWEIID